MLAPTPKRGLFPNKGRRTHPYLSVPGSRRPAVQQRERRRAGCFPHSCLGSLTPPASSKAQAGQGLGREGSRTSPGRGLRRRRQPDPNRGASSGQDFTFQVFCQQVSRTPCKSWPRFPGASRTPFPGSPASSSSLSPQSLRVFLALPWLRFGEILAGSPIRGGTRTGSVPSGFQGSFCLASIIPNTGVLLSGNSLCSFGVD